MMSSTARLTTKSRHGCGECRRKRMKCDESRPKCKNCAHRKVECPGYMQTLKWSTKYEVFKPSKQTKTKSKEGSSSLRNQLHEAVQSIGNAKSLPSLPIVEGFGSDAEKDNENEKARQPEETQDACPTLPLEGNDLNREFVLGSAQDDPAISVDSSGLEVAISTSRSTVGTNLGADRDAPMEVSQPNVDHSAQLDLLDSPTSIPTLTPTDAADEELPRVDEIIPSSSQEQFSLQPLFLSLWTSSTSQSTQTLMTHYFTTTCRVMSCFDSLSNPYRTSIPSALHNSPHIFPCMMGMAAAHLANFSKEMTMVAIEYQSEAMRDLQDAMTMTIGVGDGHESGGRQTSLVYEMLLGTIMLGMTSAWHDPSAHSLSHLLGARLLFQHWSHSQPLLLPDGTLVSNLTKDQSFIIGSMAYWECLASFITDQSLDAIAYLHPFCSAISSAEQDIYPHPWTGIATPIFYLTAQVGVLMRQKRILAKLAHVRRGSVYTQDLVNDLLEEARDVLAQVLAYTLPRREVMEGTGDPNTPLEHLCKVAKIYRWTALMELYRAFPSLANTASPSMLSDLGFDSEEDCGEAFEEPPSSPSTFSSLLIYAHSTKIVTLIASLPRSSGVFTVLCVPLISAGSAMSSSHDRALTRHQILHTSRQVGLAAFQRVAKLVQEVWTREDLGLGLRSGREGGEEGARVHWMDVMIEMRLETLFG